MYTWYLYEKNTKLPETSALECLQGPYTFEKKLAYTWMIHSYFNVQYPSEPANQKANSVSGVCFILIWLSIKILCVFCVTVRHFQQLPEPYWCVAPLAPY